MRSLPSIVTAAAYGITAFLLVGSVLLTTPEAYAEEASLNHGRISCLPICKNNPATLAKMPRNKSDAAATLESVQYALSHVGDGGSYVWRRKSSKLSGVIQPTRSFRNAKGTICRYLFVLVSKGVKTAKAEGVACRLEDGRWNLEG